MLSEIIMSFKQNDCQMYYLLFQIFRTLCSFIANVFSSVARSQGKIETFSQFITSQKWKLTDAVELTPNA